jgi:hypothetical protein
LGLGVALFLALQPNYRAEYEDRYRVGVRGRGRGRVGVRG